MHTLLFSGLSSASSRGVSRPDYMRSVSAPTVPTTVSTDSTSRLSTSYLNAPVPLMRSMTTPPMSSYHPSVFSSALESQPLLTTPCPVSTSPFGSASPDVSLMDFTEAIAETDLASPISLNSSGDEDLDISGITSLILCLEEASRSPVPQLDSSQLGTHALTPMQAQMLSALGLELAAPSPSENVLPVPSSNDTDTSILGSPPCPVSFQVCLADLAGFASANDRAGAVVHEPIKPDQTYETQGRLVPLKKI